MEALIRIEGGDRRLLAAVGEALEQSARLSGDWLVCRPGCTQCCMGPFAITQLDALRLSRGLAALEATDPARAARVRARADSYVSGIGPLYPGDAVSGELRDEDALPAAMDDAPCPALDPETGRCDLYEARPITCRTFGPVTRAGDDTLAACELCYAGATDEEMARCAVVIDPGGLEGELAAALESNGFAGMTIVAYALARAVRFAADPLQ